MTSTIPSEAIGKYEIKKVLGQGAMGLVYQALDTEIERVVALKTLHKHLLEGEQGHDYSQRFLQEAKAAARCLHPNIVTVFDYGIHNTTPYLVMEYVEGLELKDQLLSDQVITFSTTINIISQILDALEYAHERGVVHRDIKPANIMVMPNERLKVSDFGVARLDNSDLTSTGMMIGTPNYMPPESIYGLPVDQRSDLYSVGVLLFELLTRQRPNKGQELAEAIAPIDTCEHLDYKQKAQIKPIVLRALQEKPENRYQQANEFRNHLSSIVLVDDDEPKTVIFRPQQALKESETAIPSTGNKDSKKSSESQVIHSEVHAVLETSLTQFIGPSAKALIKKYSKKNHSLDDLSRSLSREIPNEEEQQAFLQSLETSGIREISLLSETASLSGISQQNQSSIKHGDDTLLIGPQKIQAVTSELAFYIGPLASRLVKKALKKSTDIDQFYQILANAIPDAHERKLFLDKIS
jgi:serine/threonine-protein kinase